MKRNVVVVSLLVGLTSIWSCSDDTSSSSSTVVDSNEPDTTHEPSPDENAQESGVECTHPGAGKPLGADRCECPRTRNVGGEWSTMRTCREGDLCTTRNKEETIVLTQEGSEVRLDRGDTYSVQGTLCGDFLVWSGGPKDGLNPECGQLRFLDDNNYVSDSCYVASGACVRTHSEGCPSLKGQCTGTGIRAPEPATTIRKVICN